VLNVVPGFGRTAGAAVSSHMDIDAVSKILALLRFIINYQPYIHR